MFGSSYENSDTDAKLEKKETGPTPKEKKRAGSDQEPH